MPWSFQWPAPTLTLLGVPAIRLYSLAYRMTLIPPATPKVLGSPSVRDWELRPNIITTQMLLAPLSLKNYRGFRSSETGVRVGWGRDRTSVSYYSQPQTTPVTLGKWLHPPEPQPLGCRGDRVSYHTWGCSTLPCAWYGVCTQITVSWPWPLSLAKRDCVTHVLNQRGAVFSCLRI